MAGFPKILVVDDSVDLRNLPASVPGAGGFRTVISEVGLPGLEIAGADLPGLVIADVGQHNQLPLCKNLILTRARAADTQGTNYENTLVQS